MPSYDAQGFYRDEQGNIAPDPRTGDMAPAMSQAISNLFGTSYTPGRAWDPSMGPEEEFDPNVPHDPTALATGRSGGGTFMPQQIGMVGGPTLPKGIQADIDAQDITVDEEAGGMGEVLANIPEFAQASAQGQGDPYTGNDNISPLANVTPPRKPEAPVQEDGQGILMSALMETLRGALGIGSGSDARIAAEARGEDYDDTKYGEGFLADVNRFLGAPLDALPGLPLMMMSPTGITGGATRAANARLADMARKAGVGINPATGRAWSTPLGATKKQRLGAAMGAGASPATYDLRNPGGEAAQAPEAVGTNKVRPTTTAAPQPRRVNQRGQPIR
tara:strand:+ start:76 stop:1074 length:999 start_codon:yes stop_codon:yes gene_type:complete